MNGLGERELPNVGLDEVHVLPPRGLDALTRLGEHPGREVHTHDATRRTDGLHEEGEVGTRAAAEVHGRIAGRETERLDGPAPVARASDEPVGGGGLVVDGCEAVVESADGVGSEDAGFARGRAPGAAPEEGSASGGKQKGDGAFHGM